MLSSIKTNFLKFITTIKSLFIQLISSKKLGFFVLLLVLFAAGIIALFNYAPKYIAKNLKKPELTNKPIDVTNQEIKFEAKDSIMVYFEGRPYWPAKNHQNQYSFDKLDGTHTFKIYSYKEIFGLGKIKSNEFIEITTTGDYIAPTFANLETKKAYPKKEDSFSFTSKENELIVKNGEEIMYAPNTSENKCKQEPSEQIFKYICPILFGDKKELTLNYTISDKAGNTTKVTDNLLIKNVELPTFECSTLPELTNKNNVDISCKTNKPGAISDVNGEFVKTEKDKSISINLQLKEGENRFVYTFKDEDGFDVNKELKIVSDTKAPTAEFTFLDTKKKFNLGSFTLKFKASETTEAKVIVRPFNETFENDPRFKEPLLAKTWGYKGGANYIKTIVSGEEAVFTTTNDMGGCQIYDKPSPNQNLVQTPQGYCYFYNVFFVKTDISLSDKAGNASQYQCTSYTWDESKNPAGELPTECKKL
jgi:hypothetical protein